MQLRNLGPQSQAMLRQAGITQMAQLQQMGSVAAYVLVKQHSPQASMNLLWALEGALSNVHWRVVARDHRTSLLLALEQHQLQSQTDGLWHEQQGLPGQRGECP